MSGETVYAGILNAPALREAIEALRPHAPYGIVESLTAIDFPAPARESIDPGRWSKGRIFGPAFELRWEARERSYHTIFTSAGTVVPEGLSRASFDLPASEEVEYYCWSERERRLGRRLDYRCVPGLGEVRLAVREYRDAYGQLIFWRYTGMRREGGSS